MKKAQQVKEAINTAINAVAEGCIERLDIHILPQMRKRGMLGA